MTGACAEEPTWKPTLSVIVLNFNGRMWINRCLESLLSQVVPGGLEIIVVDNNSTDGSDMDAMRIVSHCRHGRLLRHGANLGFCEGNNIPAEQAKGEFLLFLNNDTWLEPGCLSELLEQTKRAGADAATPLVLNYDDDKYQGIFGDGFDLCGYPSFGPAGSRTREILMPPGCAYLVRRDAFLRVGGFDAAIFMYGDEFDLSWRLWMAGHEAVAVPTARMHHRWAPAANPAGGTRLVEIRTSESKRYLANRNSLLVLLKNAQHVLLGLVAFQLIVALAEAVAGALLARRPGFVRRVWYDAVRDCWRMRAHIGSHRKKARAMRKRGDLWFLRFFRLKLNRWDEYARLRKLGLPRVS